MPHFTPGESVQFIASAQNFSRGDVSLTVIEKLDLTEVFDFIKIKPITIKTSYGRERIYRSLFEALMYEYDASYKTKCVALKLFFNKLMQALDLFEQTPERKQVLAQFLAHIHSECPYSYRNLVTRIANLSSFANDIELFEQFHLLVGTEALDRAVKHSSNQTSYVGLLSDQFVSSYLLNSISSAALGEVMVVPEARRWLLHSRENILIMLARINYKSEAFYQLLQEPDFIVLAMAHLNVHELDALIFAKMNNYQLNKVMTAVIASHLNKREYGIRLLGCWDKLLADSDQSKKYFRTMLYRMSPFELPDTVGALLQYFSENAFYDFGADQSHAKICQKIISFAKTPDVAIKESQQEFMQWLAFNLDSPQQLIVDAHKWMMVVDQAIKACEPSDRATLDKLREYRRILKNRPECIASNSTAADETWIELRNLTRSSEEKSELSRAPTHRSIALR